MNLLNARFHTRVAVARPSPSPAEPQQLDQHLACQGQACYARVTLPPQGTVASSA